MLAISIPPSPPLTPVYAMILSLNLRIHPLVSRDTLPVQPRQLPPDHARGADHPAEEMGTTASAHIARRGREGPILSQETVHRQPVITITDVHRQSSFQAGTIAMAPGVTQALQ